jgi:membrane protease YdiL (CAAX protease family)
MNNEAGQSEELSSGKVPWTPVASLVVLLLFMLWQVVLAISPLTFLGSSNRLAVQMTLISLGLFLIIWVFVRSRTDSASEGLSALQLRWPGVKEFFFHARDPLFIGIPVLIGFVLLQAHILQYFDIDPRQQKVARWFARQASAGLTPRVWFLIFLAVVAAPVTEELLFRGVMYLPMRDAYGPLLGAIIVSIIFACAHGYLAGIGHLFVLAMILAWLMEETNTVLWPILIHGLHNAGMIAVMMSKLYTETGLH